MPVVMPGMLQYGAGVVGVNSGYLGRYREFDIHLGQLEVPPGTRISWQVGLNVAFGFNQMARRMTADDEWLWILGDDHTFDACVLRQLLDRNVDIVVPLCLRRAYPFAPVIHARKDDGKWEWLGWKPIEGRSGLVNLADALPDGWIPAVGNAGMLVRRRVFNTMADPWFEVGHTNPELGGSDLWFCAKAVEAGFAIHVDTDVGIGHITHAAIWPEKTADGVWGAAIRTPKDIMGTGNDIVVQDEMGRQDNPARIDFDMWRMMYDQLTYEHQQTIYDTVARTYPEQQQYDSEAVTASLQCGQPARRILEIGGWRGELADAMLQTFPEIEAWHNVELCRLALRNPACTSVKYTGFDLGMFFWEATESDFAVPPYHEIERTGYDTLVLSHVVEHMRAGELDAVLAKCHHIDRLYIDAPIAEHTADVNWKGYFGTHILEIGWDDLTEMLRARGYEEVYAHGTAKCFVRRTPYKTARG
jgi:hypothetical protein